MMVGRPLGDIDRDPPGRTLREHNVSLLLATMSPRAIMTYYGLELRVCPTGSALSYAAVFVAI
jgi:hypothetical protein